MADTLHRDDPTEEIAAAWAVKELLRQALAARDRHTIAHRPHRLYQNVDLVYLPEATRLAETIEAWWPEILGFLETGITNARTEGTNRASQRHCPRGLRLPQSGQPTPPSKIPLHPAISRRTTSAEAAQPPQIR